MKTVIGGLPFLLRGDLEYFVASKDILIVFVSPKKNNRIYCKVVRLDRVVYLFLLESLYIRLIFCSHLNH